MHVADMLMDVFAAESAVLRATAAAASPVAASARCTRMRRGSSSTTRPCGSRRPDVRRWRPCSRARRSPWPLAALETPA